MTHSKEDMRKIAELNAAFVTLNDRGKDSALIILRALDFAQTVTGTGTYEAAKKTAAGRPHRADEYSSQNRLYTSHTKENWKKTKENT